MTQEDKQLLLRDLCARLPYNVLIVTSYSDDSTVLDWEGILTATILDEIIKGKVDAQPILRPMSSMTEEEWKELNCIGYIVPLYDGCFGVDMRAYCKNGQPHYRRFNEFSTIEDWLNAHHFDYRGLIEKGLAIKVTEKNNPYGKN